MTVTATYNVGAPGAGTLTVWANGNASNDGYYNVTVLDPVTVTPHTATAATRAPNAAGYSESFSVQNLQSIPDTIRFTCIGAGSVTCTGTTPAKVYLGVNGTAPVTASYYTGLGGTGTLQLVALATNQAGDTGTFTVPVVAAGVSVTPDSGAAAARLANSGPFKDVFTVLNTGAGTKTFTIACMGSSNVTCSTVSATSLTLAPGESKPDTATYAVGAVGTGTLTLTASATDASDAGSYRIGVVSSSQQAPAIVVDAVNPGNISERDVCFAISLGQASGSECGDLRVVHPLPITRTMDKARAPTLLYNSQLAHPRPIVAALVTLPSLVIPDSIEAVLTLGSDTVAKKRWPGSQWTAGATRRIAVAFDGLSRSTGLYAYTLEVATIYPGRLATAFNGQLVIVNRQSSPFGTGWWLAGLEQLNVGTMVWIGGDGSVRQYQQVPGTSDKWVAPSVDHPDTLKRVVTDSTYYVRYLPAGVEVWFNVQGKHRYTYNRQRHRTTFSYNGATGLLTSVALPTPYYARSYDFAYTGSQPYRLTSVTAPDNWNGGQHNIRQTTITQPNGFITQIQDPDGKYVQFAPHGTVPELIVSRTDRRGAQLTLSYDTLGGWKVAGSSLNMGSGNLPIVLTIAPQQSLGLKQSVDPAAAFTLIDGPRTDSADVTKAWQDRWSQATLIEDAHGSQTRLVRGDARWPGLATEVRHPNGWRVTTTYDARGNIATTTDYGFGGHPTTTYAWDQRWDAATKIKRPEGDSVVMNYDPATGNRLWQQDGRGDSTRVTFGYNALNQLILITAPQTPAESIGYQQQALGNMEYTRTPKGFDNHYTLDDIGRVTQVDERIDQYVTSPPSCGCYRYQTSLTSYDILDRDTLQITAGPQIDAIPSETVYVRKYFNANGQVDSLWRRSGPDVSAIGMIWSRWQYDTAGRVVVEIAADGRRERKSYDPASNLITDSTRQGKIIRMVYDALNRKVSDTIPQVSYPQHVSGISFHPMPPDYPAYTIPADTRTFTYDALGRVLSANNGDAQIARTYFPNGMLATDSARIRTVSGSDFSQHKYGITHVYDRNGRATKTQVPQQLAIGTGNSIVYGYQAQFGALQSVSDLQGNLYTFAYNARGDQYPWCIPAVTAKPGCTTKTVGSQLIALSTRVRSTRGSSFRRFARLNSATTVEAGCCRATMPRDSRTR